MQVLLRDAPGLNVKLNDSMRWDASLDGQFTVAAVRDWHEMSKGPRL